jgi:hypothetical protein
LERWARTREACVGMEQRAGREKIRLTIVGLGCVDVRWKPMSKFYVARSVDAPAPHSAYIWCSVAISMVVDGGTTPSPGRGGRGPPCVSNMVGWQIRRFSSHASSYYLRNSALPSHCAYFQQ